MLLQDVLFHVDTVAEANQRASHNDQQTQPVSIAESKSEERDEHTGIGGMTNDSFFNNELLSFQVQLP